MIGYLTAALYIGLPLLVMAALVLLFVKGGTQKEEPRD